MTLPHHTPDCTGTWYLQRLGLHTYWRCDTCHARAEPTLLVEYAAVRENAIGYQLHRLANEGKKLLGG